MNWTVPMSLMDRCAAGRRGWWRLRRWAIARELPLAIEVAAAELGCGAGLLPSLRCMAERAGPPLRVLFAPLRELESGGPALQRALHELCERTPSAELALLAHTLAIVPQAASTPRALLLRLARRLRLRQASDQRCRALLRRARWRARPLAVAMLCLPFLPLFLLPMEAAKWIATPGGRAWLVAAVVIAGGGARLVLRHVRPAPPEG
jgi:Flp pilus assembly protein TadB